MQETPSSAAGVSGGNGEQPQPQSLGFPAAGLVSGQGQGLHPGGQVSGERHQGAPDLVGGEVVQRQVGQPGVLGAPDAVLVPGAAAVPQLRIGQLSTGGVGDEGGD